MSRWSDAIYVAQTRLLWFLRSPWNRADAYYAARMWFLSFFKHSWSLEDYPVRVREQNPDYPGTPRWVASVVFWFQLKGFGEAKAAALEDLRRRFAGVKSRHTLPRPGTSVHIQFAADLPVVHRYWKLASRVIATALGPDHPNLVVTDESTLYDFCDEQSVRSAQARIRDAFGVDVSSIVDGNIAEIVRLIVNRSTNFN